MAATAEIAESLNDFHLIPPVQVGGSISPVSCLLTTS